VEEVLFQLSGETILFSEGLALLGRSVTVKTHDGQELSGTVSALRRDTGGTSLVIDGQRIPLTNLKEVELK
jgi:hypothetical protein